MDETCSSTFHSQLTGNKLETTCKTRLIAVTNVKTQKGVDYDYKVGDKILIQKDGILCKAESIWINNHGLSKAHMK